jgi:hypothetical protein
VQRIQDIQLGQRPYLGAGEGLAKGHGSKILLHDRFLLYLGNGMNAVINFDLLLLVGSHPCWIAVIGVLPHAVGPSGERLN